MQHSLSLSTQDIPRVLCLFPARTFPAHTRNARLPLEKLLPGSVAGTPRSSAVSAVWFRVWLRLSQENSDRS